MCKYKVASTGNILICEKCRDGAGMKRGDTAQRTKSTSFPGSLPRQAPWGVKRRDPGNEVATASHLHVLSHHHKHEYQ